MIPAAPPEKIGYVTRLPSKKILLTIGIIVVIVIIVAILAGGLLKPASPNPSSATAPSRAETQQPVSQGAAAQVTQQKPVDFVIQTGPQEKCGLTCRQLTPSITNTGTDTAHNVCISVVLYNSGGDLIALNGGPSVSKCVGDIASGESRSEPITIEADCGFLASKCVSQTLILKTEAVCDETTVRFPDKTIKV